MKGKRVCKFHGGLSPGRQGPRDPEHLRKLREGSQRWYAERRARKAAGLPVRRMGRIPGRRRWEPIAISRVRAMVNHEMAKLDVAQSITTTRIKVDDAGLRHQQQQDWLEAFNKKLDEAEAKLPVKER
jgi:hypothetical protein